MPGTNNFLQWNPTAANQETDAAYATDSLRTGGAGVAEEFPSPTANKAFFQWSTMVAALAAMMAAKNFNMQDGNLATLEASLANILTTADAAGLFSGNLAANGHIKFPGPGVNPLIIQWGESSGLTGGGGSTPVTFDIPFPNAAFVALVATVSTTGGDRISFITGLGLTGFTANNNGSGAEVFYIAIGN